METESGNGTVSTRLKRLGICFAPLLAWVVALAFLLAGCQTQNGEETKAQEMRPKGNASNADIIRNPISADRQDDTVNLPRLHFEHTTFDFGEIPDNRIVTHVFAFENTGKTPLLISHVRGACGCTVPHWPKDPIPPGGKGEIEIRFDPSGKEGPQNKLVTVTANTIPNSANLYISARIRSSESR